ncbi:MAG: hypothetical protein JWN52_4072 [Actinomycetia bacterium]|nr:hypothetical protein [Actinomycetes bacterium]
MRHVIMAKEWIHGFTQTRVEIAREQADRGDWISYLAVVIFIAAITTAVWGLHLDQTISNAIAAAVKSITDGPKK